MANTSILRAFERMWQHVVGITNEKLSKTDPVVTGSLSLDRKTGSTVGRNSVAMGTSVTASGSDSHAEGYVTTASGRNSHAEGFRTTASGSYGAHAEGNWTVASGDTSHAEGDNTTASGECSHVQGKYNIKDTTNKYAHIVGNGDANARSNAHTLDWDGNAWFAGEVYVGGSDQSTGDKLVKQSELPEGTTVDVTLAISGQAADAKATGDAISTVRGFVGDKKVSTQIADAISNKVDKDGSKVLSTNDYTTADKNKLSGIATGAEVNQNAFTNITVGSTTIAADSKTDTLTLVAGSNITLTPDATNDKITIAATSTSGYTHPSYTARTGVPSSNQTPAFGGTFNISQPVSDSQGHITAINSRTVTIPNTTATTSAAGLMSKDDKTALENLKTNVGDEKVTDQITKAISNISSPVTSVNNKTGAVTLSASDVSAVPTTTTINGKALSSNITLSASDIGAAASSHGDHVSFSTTSPKAAGTASVGTATTVSRSDHVHPAQTSITGNAATATKATQDGSGNVITSTYATKTEVSNIQKLVGDENVSDQITRAIAGKMESTDPSGTGSFSLNRKAGTTIGTNSVAMGTDTTAKGNSSHAEGRYTTALDYQHAQGHYNNTSVATAGVSVGTGTGTAFVIGNGIGLVAGDSNAFRVDYNGTPYAKNALTTTGCDYAEFFEWQDLNPDSEDRRGYFVTLDGDKIKIAEPNDYILGIVSGQPSVIGNGDEDWMGRYVFDEFGAFVYEEFEYEEEVPEIVDGEVVMKTVKKTGTKYKENPEYDHTREYAQRSDRPEWDAIGMLGVLSVRDDGTCQVNGYCKVSNGGIATSSETGYRVIKRVNDHIVKVIFR